MAILLSDQRVAAVPVDDIGEPLQPLPPELGGPAWVRAELGRRLLGAARSLPAGVGLRVVEGHRSVEAQRRIVTEYTRVLRRKYRSADEQELARLASRFVAPVAVAPHVAGAAVDLTLVGPGGEHPRKGGPTEAPPEQKAGSCHFPP